MVEHDRHGVNSVARGNWDLLPIASHVSSSLAHLDGPTLSARAPADSFEPDANRHLGVDLVKIFHRLA